MIELNYLFNAMPNRYRRALPLNRFKSSRPPGQWVAQWVAVELINDLRDGTIEVQYTLVGVSAN